MATLADASMWNWRQYIQYLRNGFPLKSHSYFGPLWLARVSTFGVHIHVFTCVLGAKKGSEGWLQAYCMILFKTQHDVNSTHAFAHTRTCTYKCIFWCVCMSVCGLSLCACGCMSTRGSHKSIHWTYTYIAGDHTAITCDTLQHTQCNTLQHTATRCSMPQHTATHCDILQHTDTHCNTLQHTTVGDHTSCIVCICVCLGVCACCVRQCLYIYIFARVCIHLTHV